MNDQSRIVASLISSLGEPETRTESYNTVRLRWPAGPILVFSDGLVHVGMLSGGPAVRAGVYRAVADAIDPEVEG